MTNQSNNFEGVRGDGAAGLEAEAAEVSRALDRLAAADRAAASQDFESRLAGTTAFALSASSRSRVWTARGLRIAAAVALMATGVTTWWAMRGTPGAAVPSNEPGAVSETIAASTTASGDDSEVFALIALAMDGGTGSEIETLLSETAALDSAFDSSVEEMLNGETM